MPAEIIIIIPNHENNIIPKKEQCDFTILSSPLNKLWINDFPRYAIGGISRVHPLDISISLIELPE